MEGYSLWYQNTNHKDENKRAFITSSAAGGFKKFFDELSKWLFGVMEVLRTKDNSLEIRGVLLLRGTP